MTWRVPPRLVLVPVDFGDASARALAVGGVVAHAFSAELIGLHAETLEAPPYFTHEQVDAVASAFGGAMGDGGSMEARPRDAMGQASLVTVAAPAEAGGHAAGRHAASLLRSCNRPLLFVPATRADGGHR